MISPLFSQLLIPFIIAMFLAITMGGSGTGPSFSAAYGANVAHCPCNCILPFTATYISGRLFQNY